MLQVGYTNVIMHGNMLYESQKSKYMQYVKENVWERVQEKGHEERML